MMALLVLTNSCGGLLFSFRCCIVLGWLSAFLAVFLLFSVCQSLGPLPPPQFTCPLLGFALSRLAVTLAFSKRKRKTSLNPLPTSLSSLLVQLRSPLPLGPALLQRLSSWPRVTASPLPCFYCAAPSKNGSPTTYPSRRQRPGHHRNRVLVHPTHPADMVQLAPQVNRRSSRRYAAPLGSWYVWTKSTGMSRVA